MEIHRQTCQSCGSYVVNNLVVRKPGHHQIILVRCAVCTALVARYELSGYYHHKRGLESYLRTVSVATESSLDLQDGFAHLEETAPLELEEAVATLERTGRPLTSSKDKKE